MKVWANAIQGPLATRGWILQERELSPQILHFTWHRVLWECRTRIASEEDPATRAKIEIDMTMAAALSTHRVLDGNGMAVWSKAKGLPSVRPAWFALVEDYSNRQLSVAADKLVAIAGIARAFGDRWRDHTYLAGLWTSNLLSGLAWFPRVSAAHTENIEKSSWPRTPLDPRNPSWSWALYDGPVVHCGEGWCCGSW